MPFAPEGESRLVIAIKQAFRGDGVISIHAAIRA